MVSKKIITEAGLLFAAVLAGLGASDLIKTYFASVFDGIAPLYADIAFIGIGVFIIYLLKHKRILK